MHVLPILSPSRLLCTPTLRFLGSSAAILIGQGDAMGRKGCIAVVMAAGGTVLMDPCQLKDNGFPRMDRVSNFRVRKRGTGIFPLRRCLHLKAGQQSEFMPRA